MKRLIIFLGGFLFAFVMFGQNAISYTHKPLTTEYCRVNFSVTQQDSIYYLVVLLQSDNLVYSASPFLKLKTYKGDIINLEGVLADSKTKHGGVMIGRYMMPLSSYKSIAQFRITKEEIEKLKDGIMKLRLSTVPTIHEKEFKKDKIGKKLYDLFLKNYIKEKDF